MKAFKSDTRLKASRWIALVVKSADHNTLTSLRINMGGRSTNLTELRQGDEDKLKIYKYIADSPFFLL